MKGLLRSLNRALVADQLVRKLVVPLAGKALTVDGATGIGFGSVAIEGLPEGNILFLGAMSYMQFSGSGADAGLADTWAGDYGIGTTPASDATITGTDVDIIVSTAIAAATAEVSPRTRAVGAAGSLFDNTDGSLEVNLNLLIDDADISADDVAITVDGELHLIYTVLGDD